MVQIFLDVGKQICGRHRKSSRSARHRYRSIQLVMSQWAHICCPQDCTGASFAVNVGGSPISRLLYVEGWVAMWQVFREVGIAEGEIKFCRAELHVVAPLRFTIEVVRRCG